MSAAPTLPQGKLPVIMQVIPELSAGGAEQGCIDIAIELVRSGAKAIVVSHGGNRTPEILRAGVSHVNLPVDSKNPLTMIRNIGRLRKLIKKHDVDIVHARSRAPAWSALYACRGTRARFMTTCHAAYNFKDGFKRLYNGSIARGERVIAISHFIAGYLQKNYRIDPRNIRVVHNGIALEKFHPSTVSPERLIRLMREWRLPDGASVVMMPARMTRWKGHHVLIEAMTHLNRPDLICVLIGDDQGRKDYRLELENTVREKGLEGRVRVVNHCADMPAAYMIATAVVCASIEPEGFGRVPVEAQAMGRPVVASDHGGARETVVRGETGWLVPPNDAQALAQALEEMLALDDHKRAVLATRAMGHVAAHFTREKMADETLNVYAELLQERMANPQTLTRRAGPLSSIATAAE